MGNFKLLGNQAKTELKEYKMGKLFSSSIVHITLAFAFAATVECRNGFLSQVLEEMRQEDPALRACPVPEKCEYWVDEGCNSDRNGPDDMEGFYQSQSDKAFVRCCDDSKEKTKCKTISNCENEEDLVTYVEAAKLCSDEGLRLCTKEELKKDICCKTGGQCHSSAVWTSTWAMLTQMMSRMMMKNISVLPVLLQSLTILMVRGRCGSHL